MQHDLRDPSITRTFILGAGFSVAAGFPLARDLRAPVFDRINRERLPRYHSDDGRLEQGLSYVPNHDNLGFEELLIGLKQAATGYRHPAIDAWRALETACAREFWARQSAVSNLPACYLNFAQWVNRRAWGLGNAVVTFNWDLLAELSIQKSGATFTYGLQCSDTGKPLIGLVPVLKPHGSINWSDHPRRGRESQCNGWEPISTDSKFCYVFRDPFGNPFREDEVNETRWMIFPGDKESVEEDPSPALIWQDVEKVIAERDMLVFIGYSMPPYDLETRDFFARHGRGKLVEVYTRSRTNLSGFQDVFGTDFAHYDKRFEDSLYGQTTPRIVATELGSVNSYWYA
jgi:hypothetical protein